MSAAYLPLPRWLRDRVNGYLAGMAARGFVPPPMDEVVRTASAATLPDGLFEKGGRLMFQCRVCEADTEWPEEPGLFEIGDPGNVCGGSPRCCP